jgi:FKBP-type peptidyl-prolyl cis-trans isomerase
VNDEDSLKASDRERHAAAAAEEARGKLYRDAAACEPGASVLPCGAILRTVTAGSGESPGPSDSVTVRYTARLVDGTFVDDSARKWDQPPTFPLGVVLLGWREGLTRMRVGERATLVCPASAAYGTFGRPPVPGGATVIFEIELLAIAKSSHRAG